MSVILNELSINNFNNICRTCARNEEKLISLYENVYLIEMLSTSAQIQIQLNDDLPKQICLKCIKELNQSYTFTSKCRTVDSTLRQCMTQQKLLNISERTTNYDTISDKNIGNNDKSIVNNVKSMVNYDKKAESLEKNVKKSRKSTKNPERDNTLHLTEEIYIKNEISDTEMSFDDYNNEISDDCSKDSLRPQENVCHQCNIDFENTNELINHQNKEHDNSNICLQCKQIFATNSDLIVHLNTNCLIQNLQEPMENDESSDECEFQDAPLDVANNTLPEKSKTRYKRERSLFLNYCKQNKVKTFSEDVLLDYFLEKSKTMKSSTLWSSYSMLKSTLVVEDNVDISKYPKLLAFLKRKAVGYKAEVSKVFTREEINKFLHEAPDETYLMLKVALIMGIAGGCHRDELMRMTMDHIEDKDSVLIVTVPNLKTNSSRTFLITSSETDWLKIYRKYNRYRSSLNTEHRRFFVNYKKGRFSNLPVGLNTFGRFPKLIAEYLNLSNPAQYTGHCFRRTSAMLLNRHGVWKSNSVITEGYVDDSQHFQQ